MKTPTVLALVLFLAGTASAADMVRIEGGRFQMGTKDGPADERPVHTINLKPYEIDRFPVTNAEFAVFLNEVGPVVHLRYDRFDVTDNDARIHRTGGKFHADPGFERHPVIEPTWFGARDYCQRRGARLPTEAEFERAARGPKGRAFPWGASQPDPSRAKFGGRWGDTVPVDSLKAGATPDGLFHMAGNVHQWVSSLYRPYPYNAADGREDPTDPGERVTRGGAHDSRPHHLRAAWRGRGVSRVPERGHHNIGFRCARSVD